MENTMVYISHLFPTQFCIFRLSLCVHLISPSTGHLPTNAIPICLQGLTI